MIANDSVGGVHLIGLLSRQVHQWNEANGDFPVFYVTVEPSDDQKTVILTDIISPVYTQRLNRIGIRIKLIRIRVNALIRVRIRIS